ncbi:MAG TPA: (2Fe-2S) ferredoxin domain-containing protein [Firmicutes bacterium]|nr:(2Fe-2S) ferredoxin domain-containing protein [Candidatus Fermentithermobacillaceae bacterium]
MKSIEDLERVKRETLEEIGLRDSSGSAKIVVGMGTCGIAAGARETMLALIDELKKRRQTNVTVSETGCIGLCVKEPIVEIQLPGAEKVVYGNVTPARARQLVTSHVINHQPVQELIINTGNEE